MSTKEVLLAWLKWKEDLGLISQVFPRLTLIETGLDIVTILSSDGNLTRQEDFFLPAF